MFKIGAKLVLISRSRLGRFVGVQNFELDEEKNHFMGYPHFGEGVNTFQKYILVNFCSMVFF